MSDRQKIVTSLWFDGQAADAVDYYISVFGGRCVETMMWGETGPGEPGSVLSLTFDLFDQRFIAINAGSEFAFTPAISLLVSCDDQAEIDRYWDRLLGDGGTAMACGWLTDRFGVTWQITPQSLLDMMHDSDLGRRDAVMREMMTMEKLDLGRLQQARERYQGDSK